MTAAGWRRELGASVTVAVDGVFAALDPDDPVPGERVVARVVVEMPDFVADMVAHLITTACADEPDRTGPEEWALAEALFAASQVSGYRCPTGGVRLPAAGGS